MKYPFLAQVLFVFGLFAVLPGVSHAYITTAQGATELNDTTALFTITYTFPGYAVPLYMPILAQRGQDFNEGINTLGFAILEDGKDVTDEGTAVGLVLSSAPIEDGLYVMNNGFARTFTLIVFFTVPDSLQENDYALQVTDLPFVKGDEKQQLNPSELQYYVTQTVSLNDY